MRLSNQDLAMCFVLGVSLVFAIAGIVAVDTYSRALIAACHAKTCPTGLTTYLEEATCLCVVEAK